MVLTAGNLVYLTYDRYMRPQALSILPNVITDSAFNNGIRMLPITVLATTVNNSEDEISVLAYNLKFRFVEGDEIEFPPLQISTKIHKEVVGTGATYDIYPADSLLYKTMQPIARMHQIQGWLVFEVPPEAMKEHSRVDYFELSCLTLRTEHSDTERTYLARSTPYPFRG